MSQERVWLGGSDLRWKHLQLKDFFPGQLLHAYNEHFHILLILQGLQNVWVADSMAVPGQSDFSHSKCPRASIPRGWPRWKLQGLLWTTVKSLRRSLLLHSLAEQISKARSHSREEELDSTAQGVFPDSSAGEESACNEGDLGYIPG